MALFRIRMCARGTVIWPALYRPVTQLAVCTASLLTAPRLSVSPLHMGRSWVFGTSTPIQKASMSVPMRSMEKKRRKSVPVHFRLSLDSDRCDDRYLFRALFLFTIS